MLASLYGVSVNTVILTKIYFVTMYHRNKLSDPDTKGYRRAWQYCDDEVSEGGDARWEGEADGLIRFRWLASDLKLDVAARVLICWEQYCGGRTGGCHTMAESILTDKLKRCLGI